VDTESLIASLAGRAERVRPLPPPARRWAVWLPAVLALTGAGLWVLGIRPDLGSASATPMFVAPGTLALGTALTAGAVALVLAVPGGDASGRGRLVPLALLGGWGLWLLAMAWREPATFASGIAWPWTACFGKVFAVGALPAALTYVMVRRAAPLDGGWAGGTAALAGWAMGAVGVQFACPNDQAAHLLLTHFAAVPVFALGAALAGRRWLRPLTAG
jgi:hypothetical protein